MLGLRFTAKFKKDYKRVKRQGKDLSKLESTLECHIEPDWLLIYLIDEEGLVLVATRTGSHSELLDL